MIAKEKCLTIEAGVLKVSDAIDMTQGRSRIPFEAGQVNIPFRVRTGCGCRKH